MRTKKFLTLEVGRIHELSEFESFEYSGSALTGSKAILRLHLKNKTIVDLPASDDELRRLMFLLMEAFPKDAAKHVKERRRIEMLRST